MSRHLLGDFKCTFGKWFCLCWKQLQVGPDVAPQGEPFFLAKSQDTCSTSSEGNAVLFVTANMRGDSDTMFVLTALIFWGGSTEDLIYFLTQINFLNNFFL